MLVGFMLFRADSIGTNNVEVAEGIVNMLLLVAVGIFGYWFRTDLERTMPVKTIADGKIETPFVARQARDDIAMGWDIRYSSSASPSV